MQTAARSVEAGRQAVVAASGQVAATAKTAWTVIAHRKAVAAGVGAGLTALSAASYAVGRRAGRQTHGPLTRLTGGRI
ncbi:Cystathionine beta-lyase/cystathionine gamma-synthase OS=Streptomyces violarus OX=67380 GN=FHS41_007339 PE=4 SV=1 [Streptomyces violarus]